MVHHNIGTIFLMKLDLDNASGAFTKSVALRYAINPEDPEYAPQSTQGTSLIGPPPPQGRNRTIVAIGVGLCGILGGIDTC